ncbi:glycosyltransferase, partial [Desulfovibrio sp. OttesenSCG-928-C06]|nr:glycosyltransferase [Desulfovibrio sp. OttesenSCG-928-C06]
GAASSNRIWRRQRLLAALEVGLTIYGDEGWLQLVCDAQSATADLHRIIDAPELNAADKYDTSVCCPGLDLRQPFDYYAHIYEIYSSAPFTLNLNSLLMNAGLTQRIFDVWLTGGFCLTDDSPGLFIFPEELTRAVTFRTPEELPELVRRFKESPDAKEETRRAWQSEILKKHTYRTRLETLLEQVEQACKQRQEQ